MATSSARGQRGITLIEIVLWCAIVAAAVVAVFVFGKKAAVTAAVETEQRQVADIVKTVDSIFATQPNFAALGTNGAVYLRERAARSGLSSDQRCRRSHPGHRLGQRLADALVLGRSATQWSRRTQQRLSLGLPGASAQRVFQTGHGDLSRRLPGERRPGRPQRLICDQPGHPWTDDGKPSCDRRELCSRRWQCHGLPVLLPRARHCRCDHAHSASSRSLCPGP